MRKEKKERLESLYNVFAQQRIYLTIEELEKIDEQISLDKYFELIEKIAKGYTKTEKRRKIYGDKTRGAFYKKKRYPRNRKPVQKLSKLSGRVVATYESVSLAAEVVAGDARFKGNIYNACEGKVSSYKGFKWAWAQ